VDELESQDADPTGIQPGAGCSDRAGEGDRSIVAAILCGSLSHDTVWAKSDIDLVLVTIDDKSWARRTWRSVHHRERKNLNCGSSSSLAA
jgi:hypothetical protein